MDTFALRYGRNVLLASVLLLAVCADIEMESDMTSTPAEPAAIEIGMSLTTDSDELARSLEGAGQTNEAMDPYQKAADWNFDGVSTALFRSRATDKAAMATS